MKRSTGDDHDDLTAPRGDPVWPTEPGPIRHHQLHGWKGELEKVLEKLRVDDGEAEPHGDPPGDLHGGPVRPGEDEQHLQGDVMDEDDLVDPEVAGSEIDPMESDGGQGGDPLEPGPELGPANLVNPKMDHLALWCTPRQLEPCIIAEGPAVSCGVPAKSTPHGVSSVLSWAAAMAGTVLQYGVLPCC